MYMCDAYVDYKHKKLIKSENMYLISRLDKIHTHMLYIIGEMSN